MFGILLQIELVVAVITLLVSLLLKLIRNRAAINSKPVPQWVSYANELVDITANALLIFACMYLIAFVLGYA